METRTGQIFIDTLYLPAQINPVNKVSGLIVMTIGTQTTWDAIAAWMTPW